MALSRSPTSFTGAPYSAIFSAIAVSAAQDLFEITAPTTHRVAITGLHIGQYSDAGDAAAELLSLLIIRGYTTTGSGGAAVTPVALVPSEATAASTVARNNTGLAADGTPLILVADAWNVQVSYRWEGRIIIPASTRLVVRITAPADAVTTNGTLVFEEL